MENIELLRALFLFKELKDRQIENALKKLNSSEKDYRKNSLLIKKGQKTTCTGLLLDGCATVFHEDIWGNKTTVCQIKAGQTFGEPYSASDLPSNIYVRSDVACKVLWLNISKINFAGNDSVLLMIASNLLQEMAFKLLQRNNQLMHISKKTTKEKIMSYLSLQAEENKSKDFVIPLNRQQLADYLFVERSAMAAELSALKADGKIKTRKNHFTLYP